MSVNYCWILPSTPKTAPAIFFYDLQSFAKSFAFTVKPPFAGRAHPIEPPFPGRIVKNYFCHRAFRPRSRIAIPARTGFNQNIAASHLSGDILDFARHPLGHPEKFLNPPDFFILQIFIHIFVFIHPPECPGLCRGAVCFIRQFSPKTMELAFDTYPVTYSNKYSGKYSITYKCTYIKNWNLEFGKSWQILRSQNLSGFYFCSLIILVLIPSKGMQGGEDGREFFGIQRGTAGKKAVIVGVFDVGCGIFGIYRTTV